MTAEQYEQIAKVLFESAYSTWSLCLKVMNIDVMKELREPQIGDYVIEISNPLVPRLNAVGKLVDKTDEGICGTYVIERIDGVTHTWENAKFIKVADEHTQSIIGI